MSQRIEIPIFDLAMKPFHQWDQQWFLLCAGDLPSGRFNAMTVSWGSLGILWGRPFIQVVVRPVRFTYQFIEQYNTFTLCAFPEAQRPALDLLGTRSGRDGDKIAAAGLTPCPARLVAAPAFAEAELVFECRKMYWHDLDPAHFLDANIEEHYPDGDYHRAYFGEVLLVTGDSKLYR